MEKSVGQRQALQNNSVALRQIIARLDRDRHVCCARDVKTVFPVLNAKVRVRRMDYRVSVDRAKRLFSNGGHRQSIYASRYY
jgi:hypothetical protein